MFWFLLIVFEWELDVFDADPSKWDVFHFPYGFSGFSMDFPWIFPWWTVRHGFFVRSTRTTATTGHGPLTPSPTPRSEPSPNMASVLACITASKFRWGRCRKRAIYIYISPDMVIGKMMVKIVKIVGYPIFRQIHEVMCFFFKDVDVDQIGYNWNVLMFCLLWMISCLQLCTSCLFATAKMTTTMGQYPPLSATTYVANPSGSREIPGVGCSGGIWSRHECIFSHRNLCRCSCSLSMTRAQWGTMGSMGLGKCTLWCPK